MQRSKNVTRPEPSKKRRIKPASEKEEEASTTSERYTSRSETGSGDEYLPSEHSEESSSEAERHKNPPKGKNKRGKKEETVCRKRRRSPSIPRERKSIRRTKKREHREQGDVRQRPNENRPTRSRPRDSTLQRREARRKRGCSRSDPGDRKGKKRSNLNIKLKHLVIKLLTIFSEKLCFIVKLKQLLLKDFPD